MGQIGGLDYESLADVRPKAPVFEQIPQDIIAQMRYQADLAQRRLWWADPRTGQQGEQVLTG